MTRLDVSLVVFCPYTFRPRDSFCGPPWLLKLLHDPVPKGCQFTTRFNWQFLEGAGIYIYVDYYIYRDICMSYIFSYITLSPRVYQIVLVGLLGKPNRSHICGSEGGQCGPRGSHRVTPGWWNTMFHWWVWYVWCFNSKIRYAKLCGVDTWCHKICWYDLRYCWWKESCTTWDV